MLTFLRLLYFYKLNGVIVFVQCLGNSSMAKIKLPGSKNLIHLRRGTSDIAVFNSIYAFSEFKNNLILNSEDTIVDCGANIGVSTLYFAQQYPNNQIIAIEPDRNNFILLKQNTEHWPNVTCIEGAISSSTGVLYLQNPDSESWGFMFSDKQPEVEPVGDPISMVTAYSINEIASKYHINRIGLLKVDIEGGEKDLFSQNLEWLSKVKHMILELHDDMLPHCSSTVYHALKDLDFSQKIKGEKVVLTF